MGAMKRCREGDFIETKERLIMEVRGLVHPPKRVIAFLRYIPSKMGDRRRKGRTYRKVYPIKERYEYLKENYPKYLFHDERMNRTIQAVPHSHIKRVYKPVEGLNALRKRGDLDPVQKASVTLARRIIVESGMAWYNIGVTGSVLVDLQLKTSDIDLVIYGKESGLRAYSTLKKLQTSDKAISSYSIEQAKTIAQFRWGKTGLPLEKLAKIEKKKVLHGLVDSKDYFIRIVKDWGEVEDEFEDFTFSQLGTAVIEGKVANDEESLFTPNRYEIRESKILKGKQREIRNTFSFRGRYTEQTHQGERIRAKGRVEKVTYKGHEEYYRLVLERPTDYLIPALILKNDGGSYP